MLTNSDIGPWSKFAGKIKRRGAATTAIYFRLIHRTTSQKSETDSSLENRARQRERGVGAALSETRASCWSCSRTPPPSLRVCFHRRCATTSSAQAFFKMEGYIEEVGVRHRHGTGVADIHVNENASSNGRMHGEASIREVSVIFPAPRSVVFL